MMIDFSKFDQVKTRDELQQKIKDVYNRYNGKPCLTCGAKEASLKMVSCATGNKDEIGTAFIFNCGACWEVFNKEHGLNLDTAMPDYMI
ncbi:MAG: hypothetical protein HQK62_11715 [Desulfamplus sp.]|nr:hypothetical protein [Desulfamplus sp.]